MSGVPLQGKGELRVLCPVPERSPRPRTPTPPGLPATPVPPLPQGPHARRSPAAARLPGRGQHVSLQVTVGEAAGLCPLLPGLGPTSLAAVLAPLRAQGCACLGPALPLLSAAQTASLLQALQPLERWAHCLLPLLPLQLLRPSAQALRGAPWDPSLPWSPQQVRGQAQGWGKVLTSRASRCRCPPTGPGPLEGGGSRH